MDTRLGCWLDLPSPHLAEIAAQTGFDWMLVDMEHGPIGIESASLMLMAIKATPAMGIVRLPELAEGWMKSALDIGAEGVMVPNVRDAAQAARAASLFHYAPRGMRGEARSIVRASDWGRRGHGYTGGKELIVQIEHPDALDRIEEIAGVDGVDMLFFGPADFAAGAGLPIDAPELIDHARRVADAARAAGKRSGSVMFPAGSVESLRAAGITDIAAASDVATLVAGFDAALKDARG